MKRKQCMRVLWDDLCTKSYKRDHGIRGYLSAFFCKGARNDTRRISLQLITKHPQGLSSINAQSCETRRTSQHGLSSTIWLLLSRAAAHISHQSYENKWKRNLASKCWSGNKFTFTYKANKQSWEKPRWKRGNKLVQVQHMEAVKVNSC